MANSTKLYDAVVKVGEYTDRNGDTKARYQNVGAVMRNEKGQYLVLDRTFNPAGVPGDGGVFVSFFEPKQRQQSGRNDGPSGDQQTGRQDLDDDLPF